MNLKKKRQRCGKWLLLKLIQLGFFNETIKWQTDKPFKKDTFWTSLFTSFGQTNLPKLIRTILCIIFVYPNHFLIFVSFIILINILIKINSYFLFKKKCCWTVRVTIFINILMKLVKLNYNRVKILKVSFLC